MAAIDGAYLLVVDDNPELLFTLQTLLEGAGAEVETAGDGEEAINKIKKRQPQLLLMDVVMPKLTGIEATRIIKNDPNLRHIPIILVSSKDELASISEGAAAGAEDYIRKPFESAELLLRVESALSIGVLYREVAELRGEFKADSQAIIGSIIGESAKLKEVLDSVIRMQDSEAPVLIRGESGSGKELIARAVHDTSPRKDSPFVAQNCSALHENLLESELFGHVRGAFTGAVKDKRGLFEQANGGTLFLDELGEMSLTLQAKLLRVIQYGTFTPVGSTEEKKVNVRIVAATHRPLERMVEEGSFREDLFYRLKVLSVYVPSLRERSEDIPILAQFFLEKCCRRQRKPIKQLAAETLMIMQRYLWPGNVRELENEIEKMVTISGQSNLLGPGYLAPHILAVPNQSKSKGKEQEGDLSFVLPQSLYSMPLNEALKIVEADLLKKALKECGGNKSEVSRKLEISRSNLISKVSAYGLEE